MNHTHTHTQERTYTVYVYIHKYAYTSLHFLCVHMKAKDTGYCNETVREILKWLTHWRKKKYESQNNIKSSQNSSERDKTFLIITMVGKRMGAYYKDQVSIRQKKIKH